MTRLSADVLADIDRDGAPPQILMEQGGSSFVNFLRQFAAYCPTPIYAGMVILDQPAARVMDFICHRLNVHEGRVLAKAEWMQAYWNEVVVPGGVFGSIEKGVTERVETGGPMMALRRMVAGGASLRPSTDIPNVSDESGVAPRTVGIE